MKRYYIVMKEISTGNVRSVIRPFSNEDKENFIKKANESKLYKLLRIQEAD